MADASNIKSLANRKTKSWGRGEALVCFWSASDASARQSVSTRKARVGWTRDEFKRFAALVSRDGKWDVKDDGTIEESYELRCGAGTEAAYKKYELISSAMVQG